MSKQYPLFPSLTEEGEKEAGLLINNFKEKLRKEMSGIIDETLGKFYCGIVPFIGSDSWTNFRNEIMDGFKNYDNRKIQGEYDFKEIRQQIYKEHKEDIIKDLDQDNLKEIESLKQRIDSLLETQNRF